MGQEHVYVNAGLVTGITVGALAGASFVVVVAIAVRVLIE